MAVLRMAVSAPSTGALFNRPSWSRVEVGEGTFQATQGSTPAMGQRPVVLPVRPADRHPCEGCRIRRAVAPQRALTRNSPLSETGLETCNRSGTSMDGPGLAVTEPSATGTHADGDSGEAISRL